MTTPEKVSDFLGQKLYSSRKPQFQFPLSVCELSSSRPFYNVPSSPPLDVNGQLKFTFRQNGRGRNLQFNFICQLIQSRESWKWTNECSFTDSFSGTKRLLIELESLEGH